MEELNRLNDLRAHGRMAWSDQACGWVADPEEIVQALSNEGFEECKREIARSGPQRRPTGGVWQGLNRRTGSVACTVWVNLAGTPSGTPSAILFINIDGRPLDGRYPSAGRAGTSESVNG